MKQIEISDETFEKLKNLMDENDTFDSIINKLIEFYLGVNKLMKEIGLNYKRDYVKLGDFFVEKKERSVNGKKVIVYRFKKGFKFVYRPDLDEVAYVKDGKIVPIVKNASKNWEYINEGILELKEWVKNKELFFRQLDVVIEDIKKIKF